MNIKIGKALQIEKISDFRLRINFAKEYIPTKASQEGLNKLVTTVFESVLGLLELLRLCFKCMSDIIDIFSKQSKNKSEEPIIRPKENRDFIVEMQNKGKGKNESATKETQNSKSSIQTLDELLNEPEITFEDIKKEMEANHINSKDSNSSKSKEDSKYSKVDEAEVQSVTKEGLIPILVHILDKIWHSRYEVNPVSVYIIELVYQWILDEDADKKSTLPKRILGEKYRMEFNSVWNIVSEKVDISKTDFGDSLESNRNAFIKYISQVFDVSQGLSDTKYEETLSLHLSQTPIYHLKDVLSYQEKKGQYQGDLRNLVRTIITEYEYLFEENQIREINEWLDVPETASSKVFRSPKIADKRLIKINSDYIMPIAQAFVDHFDETDLTIFIRLLEGEKSDYKVKFNGGSAQLVYAFRELWEGEKNIIANQKQEVEAWLIEYFKFYSKDTSNFEDLKINTVHYTMTRSEKKGFKIPKNPILFEFEK